MGYWYPNRLKKILADRDLEVDVMKEINRKKMVSARGRRLQVSYARRRGLSVSIRSSPSGKRVTALCGSDRAGRRATAVMSLLQTTKIHGLNPYAYLAHALDRLPGMPTIRIEERTRVGTHGVSVNDWGPNGLAAARSQTRQLGAPI